MGEVYRAHDLRLERHVAVKVLPAEMASSSERLDRFLREARAVAALSHPHIVTIHSVEESEGVHFLTMELLEGQPLARLVAEGALSVDRIVEIGVAIAGALAAAHDKGIVHRDLKPANVMVGGSGSVKVLDFGLAKICAEEGAWSSTLPTEVQTRDGVVMGTVPYMSPEQVSGRPVDQRSDVFSLGVVLYEMASGRRPFEGGSTAELASAILRDTPRALTELRPGLSSDLVRIIGRCLEKDMRRRFQTARDVGNELRYMSRQAAVPGANPAAARSDTSGAARLNEGFWIAVPPFKHRGTDPGVEALAQDLTEDIVTGLSRFSYLRVIASSSTSRYAGEAIDVRTVGQELGARYVIEGSLRQAGSQLRVTVQLVDSETAVHLWAESYSRPFVPEQIFAIQDDLVPRIVSTCADHFGVLARAISEAVRNKPHTELTPYEALMRGFGYHFRLSPKEHAEARDALERAVEQAPNNADCLAMLSWIYAHEYAHDYNPRPRSLDRALDAVQRAVDLAPSNQLAHQVLALVRFFRRETAACRSAAERALELNPLDGSNEAIIILTFLGDWERGCALIRRSMDLNPHHPRWYRFVLALNEYRKGNYHAVVDGMVGANLFGWYWTSTLLAAAYGQLGEAAEARKALDDALAQKKDLAETIGGIVAKWYEPELCEQVLDGLRKAGLQV